MSATHESTARTGQQLSVQDIYRQLRKGLGHEHVNDGNVFELIDMARTDGHSILEQELREWQAPCSG